MRTEPAVLLAALATAAIPAAAQTGPWYLALGQSISHESNIYRLADGISPTGGTRDDTVAITSVLAGFDQTISRQRLRGDLSLRASRFDSNGRLDNEGHGLRLIWDWATTGRLEGTLLASLDRSLVRFDNSDPTTGLARNIASTRYVDASVRLGLVTRWSFEAGWTHAEVDYSAPSFAAREYRQDGLSGGMRYALSPDLSFNLGLRGVQGRYPRFAVTPDGSFVADRYDGRYVDFGARWNTSAASRIDAKLSLGRTSFERATAADFSGLAGSLAWAWRPTGKLHLDTRIARDRGQESMALGFFVTNTGQLASGRFADFSRITTSLGSTLQYELTAKLTLTAGLSLIDRDLRDTRQDLFGQITTLAGRDRTRHYTLGARWQATRGIALGCEVGQERRSANNDLSSDLSNSTSSCFGQIGLQ